MQNKGQNRREIVNFLKEKKKYKIAGKHRKKGWSGDRVYYGVVAHTISFLCPVQSIFMMEHFIDLAAVIGLCQKFPYCCV